MSLWDSVKKLAQPYSDDDYDDYDDEDDYVDDYEEPQERPARRTAPRRTAPASVASEMSEDSDDSFGSFSAPVATAAPAPAATGSFSGKILNTSSASSMKQEVVLFRPTCFEDSSKAADNLRNRRAVVLNLEGVDEKTSRRVVDFLSGTVYALDGNINKIALHVYLFCPHNMDVVGNLDDLKAEVEKII